MPSELWTKISSHLLIYIANIHARANSFSVKRKNGSTPDTSHQPSDTDPLELIKQMLKYRSERNNFQGNGDMVSIASDSEFEHPADHDTSTEVNMSDLVHPHVNEPATGGDEHGEIAIEHTFASSKENTSENPPEIIAISKPKGQESSEDKEKGESGPSKRLKEEEYIIVPQSPDYIPKHLPHLPSAHTYRQTPVFPTRNKDIFNLRRRKTEQSRQAEENLQRLITVARSAPGPKTSASEAIYANETNGSIALDIPKVIKMFQICIS